MDGILDGISKREYFSHQERGLPSEEIECKIEIEEIIVISYPALWHVTLSI